SKPVSEKTSTFRTPSSIILSNSSLVQRSKITKNFWSFAAGFVRWKNCGSGLTNSGTDGLRGGFAMYGERHLTGGNPLRQWRKRFGLRKGLETLEAVRK